MQINLVNEVLSKKNYRGSRSSGYTRVKYFCRFLVHILLTTGFIFNLSFSAAPSFTTGRISLLIMLILYGQSSVKPFLRHQLQFKFFYFILFSIGISCFIMWVLNSYEDNIALSRMIWFFIYSCMGAFLYMRMCSFNFSSAMLYFMLAMLIQTVFVFCSVLSPDFQSWVDSALVNGGHIDFSSGVRFGGLSNSGGSVLSVQLSLGTASALALFIQSKNKFIRVATVCSAILITIAAMFVGRTGFYMAIFCLFCFILWSGRSIYIPILMFCFLLYFLSLLEAVFAGNYNNDHAKLDKTAAWSMVLFTDGNTAGTIDALISQISNAPVMDEMEMIFGSGKTTTSNGANYSECDAGYFQTLYAIGVPLTVLFYLSLFFLFRQTLKPAKGKIKTIGFFLIALIFIIEMKEPYIFKYTVPFFTLVFCYLGALQFGESMNLPLKFRMSKNVLSGYV